MANDSEFQKSAFSAYVSEHLGGSARAILAFQELVVEEAGELGLEELLPDIDRVSGAASDLNRLVDQLITTGLAAMGYFGPEAEATLRHDLRTPLNAIIGYSEMIAEELSDPTHEALGRDVAVVLSEAKALLDRIDAIVDFSRPRNARLAGLAAAQAHSVAVDLEAIVGSGTNRLATEPGCILVIDDVASNRDLLLRRLSRDGHEVILAESGAVALERLSERDFDLILLDILMPDMNGIELLSRIKAHDSWRRVPVIMISGLKETDAVIRCIEAGADDYLTKPFDPILLQARINACLDKKRWADREQRYLERIKLERDRADALLHAILPGQVVKRLNDGEVVIADRFESVTILFADLVGFTDVSARISPTLLVQRLDRIFSAFDDLAQHHGVEKIKTIGDAYMAAAGIPETCDDHAERVLSFARSMLTSLVSVDLDEVPFRIRIGIHTGPVVAGLLGRHRFVYDVWGEAVNIASRLESQCAPGCVLISAATRQALTSDWPVKPQGLLDLKGIGGVSAFVVTA